MANLATLLQGREWELVFRLQSHLLISVKIILCSTIRVAGLAVFRPNFENLAVFQVGWPYNFWVGQLAFFGRFLNDVWPKIFSFGRF